MFTGEYHHSLDKKNRLIIPSKLRQQIGDANQFVLTPGLDKTVFLYSLSEWENLGKRLRNLSTTHADSRAFLRLLFSGTHPVQVDNQGRITLPQDLKNLAGIKEKVTIIGAFNKIEIWSEENWNKYYREKKTAFEEIAERIMDVEI
jgi:MraZ protein